MPLEDRLDQVREELLDVVPLARTDRSDRSERRRLMRETEDEDLELPDRERSRTEDRRGEVDRVEAGEVGLELVPVF